MSCHRWMRRCCPRAGARFVDGVNGLRVHLLEAGFGTPARPLLVLRLLTDFLDPEYRQLRYRPNRPGT